MKDSKALDFKILRCLVTSNPCGTDTVMIGADPDCAVCIAYNRIAELEAENKTLQNQCVILTERCEGYETLIENSGGIKCPNCDDVGWYVVNRCFDQPEGEQEQCEFCYTCKDSIYHRTEKLQWEHKP